MEVSMQKIQEYADRTDDDSGDGESPEGYNVDEALEKIGFGRYQLQMIFVLGFFGVSCCTLTDLDLFIILIVVTVLIISLLWSVGCGCRRNHAVVCFISCATMRMGLDRSRCRYFINCKKKRVFVFSLQNLVNFVELRSVTSFSWFLIFRI